MAIPYTLTVKNNSNLSGAVCVYQRDPIQEHGQIFSLAWLTKSCHPNTMLKFRWATDYSFAWSETGILVPGVCFSPSEIRQADPCDPAHNSCGFSRQDGVYLFTAPRSSARPGSLEIQSDGTVPAHEASVGICMDGRPVFAVQALPNCCFTFRPHPAYWLAFGNFEEGEVLDPNLIIQTVRVDFPPDVHGRTAILNADQSWSIE